MQQRVRWIRDFENFEQTEQQRLEQWAAEDDLCDVWDESPEMLLADDYFSELDELGDRLILVLYDSPAEIRRARRRILGYLGTDLFHAPVMQYVRRTAAIRLDMETTDR